jgi:hypothetical protein
MTLTASKLLLLVAVICFVLAAVGFSAGAISIGWLGLAFFAASGLV